MTEVHILFASPACEDASLAAASARIQACAGGDDTGTVLTANAPAITRPSRGQA
jgi:hypothetical protein